MKRCFLKFASLAMIVALLLSGMALAETPNLYTVTLPSGESYTFPMSAAECEAAGIPLPELNPLSAGQYYPSVTVNNGREQFSVRVETDAATGEFCVTGFNLTASETSGASIAGITVGETTQNGVYNLLGADKDDSKPGAGDSMTYYYFLGHVSLTIYFDSADANAVANHIIVSSDIPGTYGAEISVQTGAEESALPAVEDMAFNQFILDGKLYQSGDTLQKLLDNGWVLPASRSVDTLIDARQGSRASGDSFDLYNGSDIVKVYVYNTAESDCALSECAINQVVADAEGKAALIAADGLQIGSSYADAAAIFGEASSQETNDDGSTVSTFEVLNNLEYIITDVNGSVTNISIRGLMNN